MSPTPPHRSEVFTIGGVPPVPVFADVTTVVLGASGSGKTQWLKRLLGLASPALPVTRGGRDLDVLTRRRLLCFVGDNDGVFLSQTAHQNVGTQHGGPPIDPVIAADALTMVGLAGKADVPTAGLSWHERRRVALARALALERPVLVLDGELDNDFVTLLPSVLIQATWLSAIVRTSTSVSPAVRQSSTVVLLAPDGADQGDIVAVGTIEEMEASSDPAVKAALAWVTP